MTRRKRGPGRPKKKAPRDDYKQPDLPDHLWRALEVEAAHVEVDDQERVFFGASPTAVATAAGHGQRTAVYKWRRDRLYQRGLRWLLAEELMKSLAGPAPEPEPETAIGRSSRYEKRAAEIYAYVRHEWPGHTVRSPLDGKDYETADEYAQHVLESGAVIETKWKPERNQ